MLFRRVSGQFTIPTIRGHCTLKWWITYGGCRRRQEPIGRSQNCVFPVVQALHRPSIAGAGSPHWAQRGEFCGRSRPSHALHSAPERQSFTGSAHRTQSTGNKRFRTVLINGGLGEKAGPIQYSMCSAGVGGVADDCQSAVDLFQQDSAGEVVAVG